jgi:DNA (cytosine-5)-methyltransferase 1
VNDDHRPMRAVSLFSNCGAGDIGFAGAGFSFAVMAELDERRLSIALLNHPSATGVPGDLRTTLPDAVQAYRECAGDERPALLAACPPCQGMSSAQSSRGQEADPDHGSRDERNLLVQVIAAAARELEPRVAVVENVQAFLTRRVRHPVTHEPVSAARFLCDSLHADYEVFPLLADLVDFGVPQHRKRSFLTFIRRDEPAIRLLERKGWAPYPWPSHGNAGQPHVSLRDALAELALPRLDAVNEACAMSEIPHHRVPVWPPDRYRMVSAIPAHSGKSAWDNDACDRCGRRTRDRTRLRCSRCGSLLPRPVVATHVGGKPEFRLVTGFLSSYRRMLADEPASTVTTASGHVGSDRTIHPWENRVLSPRECAALQTFPDTFDWGDALERWGHTNVRAMIGEAVPPMFTRKHGRVLIQLLQGVPPRIAMSADAKGIAAAHRALERQVRSQPSNSRRAVS